MGFLLTCLLRGMTKISYWNTEVISISTHMPLARHDGKGSYKHYETLNFYSHASCEAWLNSLFDKLLCSIFLLTCLLRGMTRIQWLKWLKVLFLLTCLLRGMTSTAQITLRCQKFLLTCLLRGMTCIRDRLRRIFIISTHMPLARHDNSVECFDNCTGDFYSHASCEAWQWYSASCFHSVQFLLTCLLRGMTRFCKVYGSFYEFLLTCLLRGMTRWSGKVCSKQTNFYSHASCEAWLLHIVLCSHPPH